MSTDTVSPLRQRMIEDMNARKLCAGTQRATSAVASGSPHFLKWSPATATPDDIRRFQLHLAETRPKLPQSKSSKLLIRLADWKIVAVRYWLHFDGDIEE